MNRPAEQTPDDVKRLRKTPDKMTNEVVDSLESGNVIASVSNLNVSVLQNVNKAIEVINEESSNSEEDIRLKSASNSPQPLADQNNEDAVDTEESELLKRMRGDAVGETMYSRKFILQTLMKLTQQQPQQPLTPELEDELCKVWDMTLSPEVVALLLENDAIELIIFAISISEEVRLYEILIGLLGNMCAQMECVQQLTAHAEWMEMLIKLSTCMDTSMLVQLMRVYQAIMTHVISGKEQLAIDFYNCFAACENSAKNIGFILQQSVSDTLLIAALKACNAVMASCALVEEENAQNEIKLRPLAEVFLVQDLCDGVNNAFMRLMRDDVEKQADDAAGLGGCQALACNDVAVNIDDDDSDELYTPKINCDIEVIQTYLNICTILVQLPEAQASIDLYAPSIMCCLTRVLIFLQQPMQLLPFGERQEEYLEDMGHICSCLKYFYNRNAFYNTLKLWTILKKHIEEYTECDEDEFDAFDDEPLSQYEENAFKLLRLLGHVLIQADIEVAVQDIQEFDTLTVNLFLNALQTEQIQDVLLQEAYQRLSAILNNIAGQAK